MSQVILSFAQVFVIGYYGWLSWTKYRELKNIRKEINIDEYWQMKAYMQLTDQRIPVQPGGIHHLVAGDTLAFKLNGVSTLELQTTNTTTIMSKAS